MIDLDVYNNQGIHNFSEGCLDCYFRINSEKNVKVENGILIIDSSKPKVFVFAYQEDQLSILKEWQKKSVIYSIAQLPLPKESKFTEVCYDLNAVFNPDNYENAKKRHKYLKYPFVWCEREAISFSSINADNIQAVVKLHNEWVDHKMEDEKVFKIMFPSGRYRRCCENVFNKKTPVKTFGIKKQELLVDTQYHSYVFQKKGEVVACRVLSYRGNTAYDLAFFANTWNPELSQLSNYIQVVILKDLLSKGISTVNCGSSLNSYLKNFKQHLPSTILQHYMYSKVPVPVAVPLIAKPMVSLVKKLNRPQFSLK